MSTKTSKSIQLPFGYDSAWEIASSETIASFLKPQIPAAVDVPAQVRNALEQPFEFPSLDQIVVPGDSLVFAIDPSVPSLPEVCSAIAAWFAERGTPPASMRAVIAGKYPDLASKLAAAMTSSLAEEVQIELHDPDDPDCIAYLAANEDSDPIYMNRTVVDADVVLPVLCSRASSSLDYLGRYGVFPLLSDRATRGRFYNFNNLGSPAAHDKLTDWADQAAWWTGFLASIQVIPSGQNGVAAIIAGATEALEDMCQTQMNSAWNVPATESDLTIALLDGGEVQQNWLGIARALYIANRCTRHGGAIVICTEAREVVGKSLQRLREGRLDVDVLGKKLAKDNADDAIAAALFAEVTADKHVYLVSQMKDEVIESLGLGVLRGPDELNHLVAQFGSCTILGSAQHRGVDEPSG